MVLFLVAGALTAGAVRPQESRYKNIQVLKDLKDEAIMALMQSWSREIGVNCLYCHVQGDFASEARAEKQIARKMVLMVNALNDTEAFKSISRKANCFVCHRGDAKIPADPPQ